MAVIPGWHFCTSNLRSSNIEQPDAEVFTQWMENFPNRVSQTLEGDTDKKTRIGANTKVQMQHSRIREDQPLQKELPGTGDSQEHWTE